MKCLGIAVLFCIVAGYAQATDVKARPANLLAGVAVFFLFLYLTGHDPDEQPLTLMDGSSEGR
jgi:hypothetical protein